MITIRFNQVKGHFVHFMQHEIATQVSSEVTFLLLKHSFLNSRNITWGMGTREMDCWSRCFLMHANSSSTGPHLKTTKREGGLTWVCQGYVLIRTRSKYNQCYISWDYLTRQLVKQVFSFVELTCLVACGSFGSRYWTSRCRIFETRATNKNIHSEFIWRQTTACMIRKSIQSSRLLFRQSARQPVGGSCCQPITSYVRGNNDKS